MSLLLDSLPKQKRMVVLGLDGLSLKQAQRLGVALPNIRRIAKRARTVQAEIPELSPVNWTSFFTGQGPERHGTFGFSRINPKTYELSITNSSHIQSPTIFDALSQHGLVSRVVNLPNTYPAFPIKGMLISGFVAHELPQAVYPPFLAPNLSQLNYKLEADTQRGATDIKYLLSELRATLDARLKALDLLWKDHAWDLFIQVFTETDRLFHFFMDAVDHVDHKHHMDCMRFFADWDYALGCFLDKYDALPSPKRLMVLADHGFTLIKTEVCLNTWLKQAGFLSLNGSPQNEWDASSISSESKAFALDPGRIYIHTPKFSRGKVPHAETRHLIERIKNQLTDLTFQGERVIEQVHLGSELYPHSPFDETPDLVCQASPGFDLKAKFDRQHVFGLHGRTGTHTVDGAIFYDSENFQPRRMRDTGRTILEYFNISDN